MKLRLSALCVSLLGVGCQTTADLTPTHMLRLTCEGAGTQYLQSRIAVLDVGDPVYDFGFTTGHGLPAERPCAVRDFSGDEQAVDLFRLAEGYIPGQATDWAIIRFRKMPTQGLVRFELEPVDDPFPLEQGKFMFAQARGVSENAQSCKLSVLDFSDGKRRMTHDCRVIPGQSGSPMTRIVNGKHKLVGLQIGQLWMFESPKTGRPDRTSYINILDSETVSEIEAVIAANRS